MNAKLRAASNSPGDVNYWCGFSVAVTEIAGKD